MKYVLTLLVAALVVAGVWYYLGGPNTESEQQSDAESMETEEESMRSDLVTDSDGTSLSASVDVTLDTETEVFDVSGSNFEFDMKEIRVQEGDTVTVNFTSTDGFHDWVVDEFDAATARISTGGTTSVTFVADKAGTYEFYCSVGTHRQQGMVGTLIVE